MKRRATPSWPGLSRPFTFFCFIKQDVDARDSAGMTGRR
jgi:hypothetical protein